MSRRSAWTRPEHISLKTNLSTIRPQKVNLCDQKTSLEVSFSSQKQLHERLEDAGNEC